MWVLRLVGGGGCSCEGVLNSLSAEHVLLAMHNLFLICFFFFFQDNYKKVHFCVQHEYVQESFLQIIRNIYVCTACRES